MNKPLKAALFCLSVLSITQNISTAQNVKGPTSSETSYMTPLVSGSKFTSILTVGDPAANGYKMVGIPDGLGAYDNGDGTFTLLMNHELGSTVGAVRAHGAKGAFVSKWKINKSDLSVISGEDLTKKVKLWNGTGYTTYKAADTAKLKAFGRFCSADLPKETAFYNSETGFGTRDRIFMNGEESGVEGRAFAHIVTGDSAGITYELPHLGKFSWENSVASPNQSNKTVVIGMDDTNPLGQVYVYIGTKTNTGTTIDRSGLTNGKLYGVAVTGLVTEVSATVPAANSSFTLVDLGSVENKTGAALNTESNTKGVTTFLRPEDGAWDPKNMSDFYFATTSSFTGPSRLWKLHFNKLDSLEKGGTITAVLDGTEGQKMLDNLTIDNYGNVLLQEDPGGNEHIAKMWQYNVAKDSLKLIAGHDTARFLPGKSKFLTIDEESSGIIDMQEILGSGMFLVADQIHKADTINKDLVEYGQLLAFFNPDTKKAADAVTSVFTAASSASTLEVSLFPNPVSNSATLTLNLEKSEQVTISFSDMKGNNVLPAIQKSVGMGKQTIELNTSDLKNGVYIIQVTSASKSAQIKTVIAH